MIKLTAYDKAQTNINPVRGAEKHPEQRQNYFKGDLIMKKTRRFAAMVAAMALAATMAVPSVMMSASAEVTTVTAANSSITINQTESDHVYKAYQIFDADVTKEDGEATFANIKWGAGINTETISGIYADLVALDIKDANDKNIFKTADETPANFTTPTQVAAAMKNLTSNNTAGNYADIDKVAAVFAKYLGSTSVPLTFDSTNEKYTTAENTVAPGYYLVQDEATSLAAGEAKTKYILQVADEVSVSPKSSAVEVVKKVQENTNVSDYTYKVGSTEVTDDNYNDVADYNIGDSVPFKLYGTMPETYGDYKQYYYKFSDTLDPNFTLDASSVKVYIEVLGTSAVEKYEVTAGVTKPSAAADSFEVTFADLKATTGTNIVKGKLNGTEDEITLTDKITKDAVITVEYTATLNNTAVVNYDGQRNKVKLTYSNNPNQESGGTPETGETPEDGVIVFTYGFEINKVKEDGTSKLANAQFVIQNEAGKYITVDATGKIITVDDQPTVDGNPATGVFTSAADTNIVIKGLDAGEYKIIEIKEPAGYNKLTDPITLKVTPTYIEDRQAWTYGTEHTQAVTAVTKIDYAYPGATASASHTATNANPDKTQPEDVVTIKNEKGSTLPSTGGMGTKLFIAGGGITATLAAVYLVSKKRSRKEEE